MTDAECLGTVDVVGWKGKCEAEIIGEERDFYIIREFRKANADSAPQPIISKAYKKYIDVLLDVVNSLDYREEYGKEYIFRKLFEKYHDVLAKEFVGWDSYPFAIQKKLWLGDRRTSDRGTMFPMYYYPKLYLGATGKIVDFGQKMMRIQ